MNVHPLEVYLKDMRGIRATGEATDETSFYPAIEKLLNTVGQDLKPKVRCILQLRNRGAGHPDGGLFSQDQLQPNGQPAGDQIPSRGVIEVKGLSEGTGITIQSPQVPRYWAKYRKVLVTNYRDFVLVGEDMSGNQAPLECFRLAGSEDAFWALAAHPRKAATDHGDAFIEYLKRVVLIGARIADPQDLAWLLASYARQALHRIEGSDLEALTAIRDAMEEALGMTFRGDRGAHFFESTFVQTLFYGMFSAWVLWARDQEPTDRDASFDWRLAGQHLRVPILRKLFHEAAEPGQLRDLGLAQILNWACAVLNRVDRPSFFQAFHEEHAVQYFYEPFLQAYDPDLRKELGVWYTPEEIVQYQVERVDTVLREELNIADGLADPNVYVLDPCCGTGTYLVEVLRKIYETLKQKGANALTAQKLKQAAMDRVFGFEILPAPFVISHLQLGLVLQDADAPLASTGERVAVYLTNALTGWEPPEEPKQRLMWPELQHERDAADRVKRDVPILVILGNPPYNAFAGTSPEEEGGLVEPYKGAYYSEKPSKARSRKRRKPRRVKRYKLTDPENQGGWGITKFNLDDLYIRFFRIAERRIVRHGRGVVSFITNFSYLGDPSFVVMREHLLEHFDELWFDCMNGDSRETGKLTPDGNPDPSVFSTERNKAGIRVGTAVSLLVKTTTQSEKAAVHFRHFWGATKREDLVHSLDNPRLRQAYNLVRPRRHTRYSFRPSDIAEEYLQWAALPELADVGPFNGPVERRGNSLIRFPDQSTDLEAALRLYFDPNVSDEEVARTAPRFMKSSGEYIADAARDALAGRVQFKPGRVVRYPFKPFDVRVAYLDPDIAPLFSRPAPELIKHASIPENTFLITRDTADKRDEGVPFFYATNICDYDSLSGHARHFPFYVQKEPATRKRHKDVQAFLGVREPNLSKAARRYLKTLGLRATEDTAPMVWRHVLGVGYSPNYLAENRDGLRQNWPRIPLPASKEALEASAALGEEVAALLDTESGVAGVTEGRLRPEMRCLGVIRRVGGGSLNPGAGDLDVTAGWGHEGARGATMPGKGRVEERGYTTEEREAIAEGAEALGLSLDEALECLGEETRDIYLNDVAYWRNVPAAVWDFYIGGYQVIKKWLSYREKKLLGRGLRPEEAQYVTEMVRRLAALRLLEPALDANYERVKSDTYAWGEDEG